MNVFREKRLEILYTQDRLAKEVGVDRSTIAKWETGQVVPRPEALIKLSKLFNCTVDELLKGGEVS